LLPKFTQFAFVSLISVLVFSAVFTFGAAFAYMKIIERK